MPGVFSDWPSRLPTPRSGGRAAGNPHAEATVALSRQEVGSDYPFPPWAPRSRSAGSRQSLSTEAAAAAGGEGRSPLTAREGWGGT